MVQLNKKDYENFWLSFYPELDTIDELNDLLINISNKDINTFYEERKENEMKVNDDIEYIFESGKGCTENNALDAILLKQKKKNRWVYFFKPILRMYIDELFDVVQKSDIILDNYKFIDYIIENIIQMLTNRSFRVLVLETNIARMDNKLIGKTKYDRSNYFTTVLLNDEKYLREIYCEYPELIRILSNYVGNTIVYVREIIENTEKEYSIICDTINNSEVLGKIVSIELGKGDLHNNSRSVAKIKFDTEKYLIYKPRKLDIEIKFNNFIEWLNKNVDDFYKLKSCKCHTIENAGWMEFIENLPCEQDEDISKFYNRIGQILCILYTLNSRDFHYENIIANGQYPMLIDLETVLHSDTFTGDIEKVDIEVYVNKIIQSSVVGTGLLPILLQNYNTNEVMEVGGLGSTQKRISPFKTQILKNTDSDDVYVDNIFKEIQQGLNSPKLNNTIIGPEKYLSEIKNSFKKTYIWISNNKTKYINQIKEIFSDLKSRLLYKNTGIYVQLMETSYHPDLLHNKTDREIYFHRIGLLIDKLEEFNENKFYKAEVTEMLSGDIPMFFVDVKNSQITNNRNEVFNNIYNKTILETIEQKINSLSLIDLYRQVSLINQSFISCKINVDVLGKTRLSIGNYNKNIDEDKLIDNSVKLVNLIIERSISTKINNEEQCSWIGLRGFGDDFYNISPVGSDLYLGNGGIAITIAYLYNCTKNEVYKEYAKMSLKPVVKALQDINDDNYKNINAGSFSGITSYYYSIYSCIKERLFKDDETSKLILLMESKLDLLYKILSEEKSLDIISGLSGSLGVLVSIYDIVSNDSKNKVLKLCSYIVDKFKESAININNTSISWFENGDIGYSHGNAGIICQMMRLYNIIHDEEILVLIQKCLNYERAQFDSIGLKWKLRKNTQYFSWCNGIGGLLLSKLILYKSGYTDNYLLEEINLLIEQLTNIGFGAHYSICHGDIGSLSILYYAAFVLKDTELRDKCNKILGQFNEEFVSKNEEQFKVTEDWGLMTGVAGIALGIASLGKDNIIINTLLLK